MPASYEDIRSKLLEKLDDVDTSEEDFASAMKNLKILEESYKINQDVNNVKEEKKNFFQAHSSELIRVGGTLATVVAIGFIETKFDVIFRSKASKYL